MFKYIYYNVPLKNVFIWNVPYPGRVVDWIQMDMGRYVPMEVMVAWNRK